MSTISGSVPPGQTGLAAQVLDGLSAGDVVIIHPNSGIEDGVEVEGNW
ncbi:MAG: hypothetical protein WD317_10275 [Balneolaceae bacterium]